MCGAFATAVIVLTYLQREGGQSISSGIVAMFFGLIWLPLLGFLLWRIVVLTTPYLFQIAAIEIHLHLHKVCVNYLKGRAIKCGVLTPKDEVVAISFVIGDTNG